MVLRLEDIVHGYDFERIEYRMFLKDGSDTVVGNCKYVNGELISLDGDSYSLKDRVLKYEIKKNGLLVIWCEDWGTE